MAFASVLGVTPHWPLGGSFRSVLFFTADSGFNTSAQLDVFEMLSGITVEHV